MAEHRDHNYSATLLRCTVLLTDCCNSQFFLFQAQCWHYSKASKFSKFKIFQKIWYICWNSILIDFFINLILQYHSLKLLPVSNQLVYCICIGIGLLCLYFWQIFERSAIAVTRHCSPINTTGPSTPVSQCGLFCPEYSDRQRCVWFSKPCIHRKVPTGPELGPGAFPGVMNWTPISLYTGGLDRKLEMSSSGGICPPCVSYWYPSSQMWHRWGN